MANFISYLPAFLFLCIICIIWPSVGQTDNLYGSIVHSLIETGGSSGQYVENSYFKTIELWFKSLNKKERQK